MTLADQLFARGRGEPVDLSDPTDVADVPAGLAIQLEVLDRWRAAGERVGGWKVAMSAGIGRQMVEEGFRPFGFVLESRIFPSGAVLDLDAIDNCAVEPEIAVLLATPLAGSAVTTTEARAAVRAIAPAFELNAVRIPGASLPVMAADDFAQWGIVLGPEIDPDDVDLMSTVASVAVDGRRLDEVAAEGFLDDPYLSLTRLCASLDRFGLSLAAGDRVITGGFSNHPVTAPGRWRAEFSGLGAVEAVFQ